MIAVEHVKQFRLWDLVVILVLSLLWFFVSGLLVETVGRYSSYLPSVLAAMLLMSFAVLLVQKAGTATLFFSVGGLLSAGIPDLGPVGLPKVLALVGAGLVFEVIFLVLKIEVRLLQLDILGGTALASAFLPLLLVLFNAPVLMVNMMVAALNLAFVSFFVGVLASTISFLVWFHLKPTKAFLRFQYGV